jgi:hypothetical protein
MKISIEETSKSFLEHLEIPENTQIVFSGRFGIGKSFFLDDFFDKNQNKFEAIILSPVNYSVSSNKDIFEYIKYDILFELLRKGVVDNKVALNSTGKAFSLLQSIDIKAFGSFLKMIPQVGKDLSNVVEGLTELKGHFEDFKKKFDQERQITDYLKSYTGEIGSIYEENFITTLINELLHKLKGDEEEDKKDTVLIIEDLDRLDPDHIFRILNIFSVHTNYQSGRFKFDFNKIILVCDINNIQNIYKHRYGSDVDFEGYMDKFYSHEVFHFKNRKALIKEIEQLIIESTHPDESNLTKTHNIFIAQILIAFIENDILTPRQVRGLYNFKYISKKQKVNTGYPNVSERNGSQIIIFIVIDYLCQLLKGFKKLKSEIDVLKKFKNKSKVGLYHNLICATTYLLDYQSNLLSADKQKEYQFNSQLEGINYIISYKAAFGIDAYNDSNHDSEIVINEIKQVDSKLLLKREDYQSFFFELFYQLLEKIETEKLFDFD